MSGILSLSLRALCGLGILVGSICMANADDQFVICGGEQDGCPPMYDVYLTCENYGNMTKGGKIKENLGRQYCSYTDGHQEKLRPYSVVNLSTTGGHGCGTAVWRVTCFSPK